MAQQIEVVGPVASVPELRLKVNSILKRLQKTVRELSGVDGEIELDSSVSVSGIVSATPTCFYATSSADESGVGYYTFDFPGVGEWSLDPSKQAIFLPLSGTYFLSANVQAVADGSGDIQVDLLVDGSSVVSKVSEGGAGETRLLTLNHVGRFTKGQRVLVELVVGADRVGGALSESSVTIYRLN